MNIAEPWTVLKAELLQNLVPQVLEVLTQGCTRAALFTSWKASSGSWPCNWAVVAWPPSSTPAVRATWEQHSRCPTATRRSVWNGSTAAATCRFSVSSA